MSNIKVEMLSIDDFNHICRTCSSDGELKSLFDNIETLSMLESFTQMQFSKTDELPDKICANCLTKINDCFHFINNCKIVDEGLRKCLNNNLKQLDLKTDQLHSSIDIEQDEEPEKPPTEPENEYSINEQSNPESSENMKEINVKQSEYYILKWGSPTENQENRKFQFTVVNNASNEQDLVEQEALRRLQAMNRMRRLRARIHHPTADEGRSVDYEKKIPTFSVIGEKNLEQIGNDHYLDQLINHVEQRSSDHVEQRDKTTDESHRARAKLTLPHEEHNAIARRNYETPERIALRRALAREQMRKYRSKLTADETAEHRAQVSENMRKFRVKLLHEDGAHARDYMRRMRVDVPDETKGEKSPLAPKLQIPLRLSEMAQTLLQSNETETTKAREMTRFSLRPSKIPQVKKECLETRLRANEHQLSPKFRSWKRNIESPDVVTIRLAKTALQMKRLYSSMKEPGQVEESALRRAKAAGQLRQYRPMLRKNKPNIQTGK